MNKPNDEIINAIASKIPVDKVYDDLAHSTASETGKAISKIPRAINAILAPFEKWMLQREYSIKETEKLLALKLESIEIDDIRMPEAHIAIPTLQAIEYCYDSEILRDMYASLLANAMDKKKYMNTHPAYVEIIKQLTPDEVKILNALPEVSLQVPMVDIVVEKFAKKGTFTFASNITALSVECGCDLPDKFSAYIGNLVRLGLIEIPPLGILADQWRYDEIYETELFKSIYKRAFKEDDVQKIIKLPKCYGITDFGDQFRKACKRNY